MIRQAKPGELTQIARLDARCFERPWTLSAWETEQARAFARIWVWAPAGDPTRGADPLGGYCVCWHLGQEAELLRIAVAPEHRGQGVGATLLDGATSKARQEGCRSMSLEVQHDNLAALSLYENAGFERVGERAGYYQGKDALLLRVQWLPPSGDSL